MQGWTTVIVTVLGTVVVNGIILSFAAGKVIERVDNVCKVQDKHEKRIVDIEKEVWQKHSP